MKIVYQTPIITTIQIDMNALVCLSLNGGTEPMSQGDLEDIVIDDPFIL